MRLEDLKAKLLFFFVRRLRSWANSVELHVSQSQPKEESVEESSVDESAHSSMNQIGPLRAGGPPKHWVDLVRQKAPDLLSSTGTSVRLARVEEDLQATSPEAARPDVADDAQPERPRQHYSRVPSVRGTLAKAKKFTPARPFSIKPKKPSPPPTSENDPIPDVDSVQPSSPLADENSTAVFQRESDIPVSEPARPISQKSRPRDFTEIHRPGSKSKRSAVLQNVAFSDFENVMNKNRESPFVGTTADYGHSQTTRQTERALDISSQDVSRAKTGKHSRKPAQSSRFVDRSFGGEPKRKAISFVTKYRDGEDMAHRQTSIASSVALSRSDQSSTSFINKSQTFDSRLSPLVVSPASAVRSPEFSKAIEQRPDVNVPTLMDEETMNRASTVRFGSLASDENPWPDLPHAVPLELAEELAANERELDRYRRLEREQRGTLWNE
jgi:hypothetical protein